MASGIELSLYVLLGIGGRERSHSHAQATATALNAIVPNVVRLRTLLPKKNTPLLDDILSGQFQMLGPHEVLRETRTLIEELRIQTEISSDHYTNYIAIQGKLPRDTTQMLNSIDVALDQDVSSIRPVYIGDQ